MADVDETQRTLLHNILALGYSACGQPNVTASQGRVACKRHFSLSCENTHTIVSIWRLRFQEKGRFAKIRPSCKSGHLLIAQCVGANDYSKRIAKQRFGREYVKLLKGELGRACRRPWLFAFPDLERMNSSRDSTN